LTYFIIKNFFSGTLIADAIAEKIKTRTSSARKRYLERGKNNENQSKQDMTRT
jgi:hypothetical protein